MAMIDEWGEQINEIEDEGVFSESALGDYAAAPQAGDNMGFPNTMPTRFPYAPTPGQAVQRIAPNRYGLYAGGGPQVNAAFPGAAMSGCGCAPQSLGQVPVRQATAGMGAAGTGGSYPGIGTGWDIGPQTWAPSSGIPDNATLTQPAQRSGSGVTAQQGFGMGIAALDAIGGIVAQGVQLGQQRDLMQFQMSQASQQAEQQSMLLLAQIEEMRASGQSDRAMALMQLQAQLEAASAAAQGSGSQTDLAALLSVIQQAQAQTSRPVWPWLLGGALVLGAAGTIIYLLVR